MQKQKASVTSKENEIDDIQERVDEIVMVRKTRRVRSETQV